jgi:uncharacterized protein YjbI with pentapeptide repeats
MMAARYRWVLFLAGACIGPTAWADIYEWEYVNPGNPSLGKRQSNTLTPGGSGLNAAPGEQFNNRNLTQAYFIGADLYRSSFYNDNLTNADFSAANLTDASIRNSTVTGATFQGAQIVGAYFNDLTSRGFTSSQFYSTASYQAHDLRGVELSYNNLTEWNFAGQNLTGGRFTQSQLTNADFAGALVSGTWFSGATTLGFTAAQLYSTASYQAGNMIDMNLAGNDLTNWNFAGQDLTNVPLQGSSLGGTNFSNAIINGVDFEFSNGFSAEQLYSTASYQQGDLRGVHFANLHLTDWNLAQQDLRNANFFATKLMGTDFSQADIRGARFEAWPAPISGLTAAQLVSTATYQTKDLTGTTFERLDLSGVDFGDFNLTEVSLGETILAGANFSGANIRLVNFGGTTQFGFTDAQFYSTASYQEGDLRGVRFFGDDLSGWNFAGQNLQYARLSANLTGANFRHANLTDASLEYSDLEGANFTGVDARGAYSFSPYDGMAQNLIDSDGIIWGLDLTLDPFLLIRDYDGSDGSGMYDLAPVHIEDGATMNPSSTLELRFDADEWNSTISFEAGIAVTLDGILDLTFADDVNILSQVGRTLDLFDWTGVVPSGTFTVAGDYEWDLTNLYTTGEVTLLGVTILPGDVDGDGDVDGRDFLALQRDPTLGSIAAWQANYGDSVSSLANFVPVPEPGPVLLTMLVALLLSPHRRGLLSSSH